MELQPIVPMRDDVPLTAGTLYGHLLHLLNSPPFQIGFIKPQQLNNVLSRRSEESKGNLTLWGNLLLQVTLLSLTHSPEFLCEEMSMAAVIRPVYVLQSEVDGQRVVTFAFDRVHCFN